MIYDKESKIIEDRKTLRLKKRYIMLQAVEGIYENGSLKLLEKPALKRARVIVTFLEEVKDKDKKITVWRQEKITGWWQRKVIGLRQGKEIGWEQEKVTGWEQEKEIGWEQVKDEEDENWFLAG